MAAQDHMWHYWWAAGQISSLVMGLGLWLSQPNSGWVIARYESDTFADRTVNELMCVNEESTIPLPILGTTQEFQRSLPVTEPPPTVTPLPTTPTKPTNEQVIEADSPAPTRIPLPTINIKPTEIPKQAEGINGLINSYRQEHGKNSLQTRDDLCSTAQKRSEQIQGNFSHDGFEQMTAGLGYQGIAENIWMGTGGNPNDAVSAWDQSDGHRQNMLGDWVYGCGGQSGIYIDFLFMR